jgi:hypothetical protein
MEVQFGSARHKLRDEIPREKALKRRQSARCRAWPIDNLCFTFALHETEQRMSAVVLATGSAGAACRRVRAARRGYAFQRDLLETLGAQKGSQTSARRWDTSFVALSSKLPWLPWGRLPSVTEPEPQPSSFSDQLLHCRDGA